MQFTYSVVAFRWTEQFGYNRKTNTKTCGPSTTNVTRLYHFYIHMVGILYNIVYSASYDIISNTHDWFSINNIFLHGTHRCFTNMVFPHFGKLTELDCRPMAQAYIYPDSTFIHEHISYYTICISLYIYICNIYVYVRFCFAVGSAGKGDKIQKIFVFVKVIIF